MIVRVLVALLVLGAAPATAQETWQASPGRYTLNGETVEVFIEASRFLMSDLHAEFHTVSGELLVVEEGNTLMVEIASADLTGNGPMVEGILKGENFLNVETHPTLSFTASGFAVQREAMSLTGNLTMAGVTHPATFTTQLDDADVTDGETVTLTFEGTGRVRRADWGMTSYPGVVGQTINVTIRAEFDLTGN